MNTVTYTALTAALTAASYAVDKKPLTARFIVGTAFYMLFLSILAQTDSKFASRMALTVFILSVYLYGIPFLKSLGVVK